MHRGAWICARIGRSGGQYTCHFHCSPEMREVADDIFERTCFSSWPFYMCQYYLHFPLLFPCIAVSVCIWLLQCLSLICALRVLLSLDCSCCCVEYGLTYSGIWWLLWSCASWWHCYISPPQDPYSLPGFVCVFSFWRCSREIQWFQGLSSRECPQICGLCFWLCDEWKMSKK